jgi:hypothetical protein
LNPVAHANRNVWVLGREHSRLDGERLLELDERGLEVAHGKVDSADHVEITGNARVTVPVRNPEY